MEIAQDIDDVPTMAGSAALKNALLLALFVITVLLIAVQLRWLKRWSQQAR